MTVLAGAIVRFKNCRAVILKTDTRVHECAIRLLCQPIVGSTNETNETTLVVSYSEIEVETQGFISMQDMTKLEASYLCCSVLPTQLQFSPLLYNMSHLSSRLHIGILFAAAPKAPKEFTEAALTALTALTALKAPKAPKAWVFPRNASEVSAPLEASTAKPNTSTPDTSKTICFAVHNVTIGTWTVFVPFDPVPTTYCFAYNPSLVSFEVMNLYTMMYTGKLKLDQSVDAFQNLRMMEDICASKCVFDPLLTRTTSSHPNSVVKSASFSWALARSTM
jgi:hypothetical protein